MCCNNAHFKNAEGQSELIIWTRGGIRFCNPAHGSCEIVFTGTGIRLGTGYRNGDPNTTFANNKAKITIDGKEVETNPDLLKTENKGDDGTWDSKNGQANYKYKGDWKAPSSKKDLMTADQYTGYFMSMYESLVKDVGLEFIGILPVRSMTGVSSKENLEEQQLVDLVAPRASQFAMNFAGKGNIAIVTLVTDIARTESYPDKNAEGWGYIGCFNIHYNQLGYNAIGKDSALNAARLLTAYDDKKAQQIRVYDTNGRNIIENGASVRMECGSTKQITAIVLPLYAEARSLTFTPSDPEAVRIDANGLITVPYSDDSVGKEVAVEISNGELKTVMTD